MSSMGRSSTKTALAAGGVLFAAVLMIMNGLFQFFQGIMAVAKDDVFVSTTNYVFQFNTTSWGWIHLIFGLIIAVVGFFLLTGAVWARAVAIALVGLQALTNFFFLPYYPWWALVIIALDIFVIWALATAPTDAI